MKYSFILYFLLFIAINSIPGGWEKGSFRENDLKIDRAYKKAFELYSKENPNSDIDSIRRLTLYKQLVNGINYRMCFIDLKSDLNVIQEYIISGPPFGKSKSEQKFELFEKNTYKPKKGLLLVNDSKYPRIQNTLYGWVKNLRENLLYITKIEIVEAYLDNFYIVTARTEEKEHIYVVSQSKQDTDEYEALAMLK